MTLDRQPHATHPDAAYAHLPATEDQPLLLWRDTRLLLDFLLDPSDLDTGGGARKVSGCASGI